MIVWILIKIRNYLINFNRDLILAEEKVNLFSKKILLTILLTAVDIQKYKNQYINLKNNLSKFRTIIKISRYIYKRYQSKLL